MSEDFENTRINRDRQKPTKSLTRRRMRAVGVAGTAGLAAAVTGKAQAQDLRKGYGDRGTLELLN